MLINVIYYIVINHNGTLNNICDSKKVHIKKKAYKKLYQYL